MLQEPPHLSEHRQIGCLGLVRSFTAIPEPASNSLSRSCRALGSTAARSRPACRPPADEASAQTVRRRRPARRRTAASLPAPGAAQSCIGRPGRPVQAAALHVVEGDAPLSPSCRIQRPAKPATFSVRRKPLSSSLASGKVDRQHPGDGGESVRPVGLALDAQRPPPAMHDLVVYRNVGGAATPPCGHASGVVRFEVQQADQLGTKRSGLRHGALWRHKQPHEHDRQRCEESGHGGRSIGLSQDRGRRDKA